VLAVGDPIPPVDPHEAARGELAQFDPGRDLLDADSGAVRTVPVGLSAGGNDDIPPVATRGPSGFPLLATALISGPLARRALATAATPCQQTPETATAIAAPPLPPSSLSSGEAAPGLASGAQPDRAGRARSRRGRQASSLLPGVTVAFALGVGLLLPDLVAVFQFASPSRPRLRLGPLRRALRNGRA
jgi:hypothetical protein